MKLLACLLLLFVGITPVSGDAASVIIPCYVYQSASFDTKLLVQDKEVGLQHGEKVTFLEEVNNFCKIEFIVENEKYEGYVYSYYLTFNKVDKEIRPVFNGKTTKETPIYDLNKNLTEFKASKGQGVYIYQGYSSKEEFVAVGVVLEDGSVYYGLMKTADVAPNGINGGLITGIVVIASCLTIIFLLLFMKKKKSGRKS